MIVKRYTREGLVDLLGLISSSRVTEQEGEALLIAFCLNCPDPGGAMDVFVEAPRGTTDMQIVERAFALPPRDLSTWSEEELSLDHPLRHWRLES